MSTQIVSETPTGAKASARRGVLYSEHIARLAATPTPELERDPRWPEAAVSVRRHPELRNPAYRFTSAYREPVSQRQWVFATWRRSCGCVLYTEHQEPDAVIYFGSSFSDNCFEHRTSEEIASFERSRARLFASIDAAVAAAGGAK